jgi:hypothetical protein
VRFKVLWGIENSGPVGLDKPEVPGIREWRTMERETGIEPATSASEASILAIFTSSQVAKRFTPNCIGLSNLTLLRVIIVWHTAMSWDSKTRVPLGL